MVKKQLAVQPILIETDEPVTSVVFSQLLPDSCVVLFENAPPQAHDLRLSGPFTAYCNSKRGFLPEEPTILVEETRLPIRFRTPASHVAYRYHPDMRPSSEVAFVFGEDDSFIHRFNLRTGKQCSDPMYFTNGSQVSYSECGQFLAAGSTAGIVSAYDLYNEEPLQITTEAQRGGIRALCFNPDNSRIQFATEFNSVKSLSLTGYEEESQRHVFTPEGENPVQGLKINAMACAQSAGLMALAGVGNQIWTLRSEAECGEEIKVSGFTRIDKLQFVESRSELLVLGDGGLAILPYEMVDGLPHFATEIDRHQHASERVRLVGAHHYGDLLCLVLSVPKSR